MTKRNHEDNHSFTEHLKTKKYGKSILIDWEQCIGECFDIKFNGEVFKVEITGYEKRNGKKKYIKLKSDQYGEKWVSECRIKAAEYGYYTTNPVMGFLYQIGEIVQSKGCQFEILEQFREEGRWEKMYRIKCLTCGGTSSKPELALRKQTDGCGVCNSKIIEKGVNDIATEAKWMIDLLANPEDAFRYSPQSGFSIKFKCPSCQQEKEADISNVYNQGLGCKCNKHNSLPERFCFSILKQLNINFKTEHYIKDRRFDFWIESMNLIIETHGGQHYKETGRKDSRTLQEEQENDIYKEELARKHGVENYIVVSCPKSNLNFLKSQFLKSELAYFFNLEAIDWNQVYRDCQNSIMEEVANLHNQGYTRKEIGQKLGIAKTTAGYYVHEAFEVGLIKNLRVEMPKNKKIEQPIRFNVVKHLETGFLFVNYEEAAKVLQEIYQTKMTSKGISRVIRGEGEHYKGLHFERATKEEFLAFKDQNQLILPERLELPKVKRKDFGDKISRSIDLSSLPYQITRKGKIFTWEGAVGKEVPFVYDKVQGTLLIKAIERINGRPHLTIQLEDYPEYRIDAWQLRRVGLGNYLKQLNLL